MRSYVVVACMAMALFATGRPAGGSARAASDEAFLGRWDITATGTKSGLPKICWLEVRREQGTLKGRFNAGGGAVFDLPKVAITNGELVFEYPRGQAQQTADQVWKATSKNGGLAGTAQVSGQSLTWTGVHAPVWPATPPSRRPGKPLDLFDGKDVSGWLCQDPRHPMRWSVQDGILMNEGKDACNIYSTRKFGDFHLDVEFSVDPDSNSGVYLRGRYEIQILDGYSRPMDVHSQGALYGFIVPAVKADKPAGLWQTFAITLIQNRLTVVMNDTKIIDNAEVPGITGGALDANEKGPGPIMLQGDHGRVKFRKVRLTPLI